MNNDEKIRRFADEKGRCRLFLLIALAANLLDGLVVTPLHLSMSADIVYQETVLPYVLYVLGLILSLGAVACVICGCAAFAYLSYNSVRSIRTFCIQALLITVIRAIADVFMTIAANGFEFRILNADDFIYSALKIAADAVIIVIVACVAYKVSGEHFSDCAVFAKSYRIATGNEYDERERVFPFKKFLSMKNPVEAGFFAGALANAVIAVVDSLAGIVILAINAPEESFTGSDFILTAFEFAAYAIEALIIYTACYFGCRLILKNKSRNTAK